MELMANERKIINTQPLDYLFTQGESGVDRIPIVLPLKYGEVDLTALRWSIQLVSEQDTFISKPLFAQADSKKLTVYWEVDGDCTAVPGKIRLTVVGISESGNEVIKFDGREIMVKAALYGSFVPAPDTLAVSLAQVQKYAEEAVLSAEQAGERADQAGIFAQAAEKTLENGPLIGENGRWFLYDAALGEYRDSGVSSYGQEGKSPYIGEDGYWFQWDQEKGAYQKTGVLARGPAGSVVSVNGVLPDDLGNVQVEAGVASVFGRSGAVAAQEGDYNADQIAETSERVFVSPGQRQKLGRLSGENILVNGYLASPVNQRGQTTYQDTSGTGTLCIDHWWITNHVIASPETSPEKGELYLNYPADTAGMYVFLQKVENFAAFRGKTLTFSMLFGNLTGSVNLQAQFQPDYTGNIVSSSINSKGLLSLTFTVPEDAQMLWVCLVALEIVPFTARLVAAKLELGEEQTLARQEGSSWTLLDPPPDPVLELAKCQRYYQKKTITGMWQPSSATAGSGYYFFPEENNGMRVSPTVLSPVDVAVYGPAGWNGTAAMSIQSNRLTFTVSNVSGQTANTVGFIRGTVTLDAEMY